jgi:hypothetical protein
VGVGASPPDQHRCNAALHLPGPAFSPGNRKGGALQAAGKPLPGIRIASPDIRKSLILRLSTCALGRFWGLKTSFSAACEAPPFQQASKRGEKSGLDETREMQPIDKQCGCPHYLMSVIGRGDLQDEGRIPTACRAFTISPASHTPHLSVIGRCEHQDEEECQRRTTTVAIERAAHTTPHRLSAVSGERMNQLADFENRQSPIANRKITRLPNLPCLTLFDSLRHTGFDGLVACRQRCRTEVTTQITVPGTRGRWWPEVR